MTRKTLFDPAGPRTKRRHLAIEIVAGLALAALAYLMLATLTKKGVFSANAWAPFKELGLWKLLGEGLWNNIAAALVGMVLSLAVGCILAFGLVSTTRLAPSPQPHLHGCLQQHPALAPAVLHILGPAQLRTQIG